jgi:hypothetical protein
MRRELELLPREFSKKSCTVLRKELNLNQTQITQAAAPLLRETSALSKKHNSDTVVLITVRD